jgi:hypothetical protein
MPCEKLNIFKAVEPNLISLRCIKSIKGHKIYNSKSLGIFEF